MVPEQMPQIRIPAGARFGYSQRRSLAKAPAVLIETREEITLDAGLHLMVAPNGLGKTTLLRTLAGLHPSLSGRPMVRGRVVYLADELKMDAELNAGSLFRSWFRGKSQDVAEGMAEMLKLNRSIPIGQLSKGNRQKVLLVIAETLAAEPGGVLLLDEPLNGLDTETREVMIAHWSEKSSPATLRLVVMHELEAVRRAHSLISISQGVLCQTRQECRGSWVAAYQHLRQSA